MTVPSVGSRRAREIVMVTRVGLALALIARPQRVLRLAGTAVDKRAIAFARLLGARHLVQVSAQALSWNRVLRVCALIDTLHASSMFILAVIDRPRRKVAIIDASLASAFLGAEVLASGDREG